MSTDKRGYTPLPAGGVIGAGDAEVPEDLTEARRKDENAAEEDRWKTYGHFGDRDVPAEEESETQQPRGGWRSRAPLDFGAPATPPPPPGSSRGRRK